MKNLFVNVFIVLLFTCMVLPHSDAASASFSGSMSVSNTPSFSSSLSASYSATQSYSQSAALTQTATYSTSLSGSIKSSLSGVPTFTATVGTIVPPPGNYRFENRCPLQSTAVCPFWGPHVYPSYRLTIMDSTGTMLTYDNIVVPLGELPQFPVSFDSTNAFIRPSGTYRFQLFGCTSPGVCVEAWFPLVVTTSPRRKLVCDPNYVCRVICTLVSGSVVCTWQNTGLTPYKRAVLRIVRCISVSTFTSIYISRKIKTIRSLRRPKAPQPTTISLGVPSSAICQTTFILRYHPINRKERRWRYVFFT